jgi:hypothetical protein
MAKVDSIPGLGALKDFIKDPIKDFLLTLGKKSGTPPVEEFSPSLKAAEALKQEKGPYEQLKATMINKHGAKEAEMDWSGTNDRFAGKTVTKSELVDYLSGRSRGFDAMQLKYNDPTDLIKESTNVAKGLMIDPPRLTRVMSKSAPASEFFPISNTMSGGEIAMGLPSPKELENFRSQVRYFVAEQGSDKPIQGSDFYDSLDEALDVSDRINAKRIEESGMKSGQKIVSPDALTYTEGNFPLGGTDTAETVYRFDDPTGIYNNAFVASHKFDELPDDNVLAHTRTAQFPVVDGGKGYHLGEIQSDIYQNQRRLTKLGRAPGEELRSRSEELALREKFDSIDYHTLSSQIVNSQNKSDKMFKDIIANLRTKVGMDPARTAQFPFEPGIQDEAYALKLELAEKPGNRFKPSETISKQIKDALDELEGDINNYYLELQKSDYLYGLRDQLEVYNMKNKTDRFKQLPYGESTNQWVDMVLRKELAKAIDSGSEFMTIPSSDLVRKYTEGSEEGQGKFYFTESELGIVPKRLNKLAKKYDPNISLIPRQIKTQAGDENVMALPLTQKLIDNIMNKGLPKYAVPITGGSLGALSFVEGEQQ